MFILKTLVAFTFFIATLAFADSTRAPSSYTVVSPNNKFVFVMLATDSERELYTLYGEDLKKVLEVRKLYTKSGMYKNNRTKKMLWSVDWFAYGVEIADDGSHIIRPGPWARSVDDDAITFYKNGTLTNSYKINQLIKDNRKLEHTVSHFFWKRKKLFDRKKLIYYLETADGNIYTFDVRNGHIVPGQK